MVRPAQQKSTHLSAPRLDGLVQDRDVRDVSVLHRVELLQVDTVAVRLQLWKGLSDAQVEVVALRLGLDDVVAVQLQSDASDQAVGLHDQQTYALAPAEGRQGCQLVLGQVRGDDEAELLEIVTLCVQVIVASKPGWN